MTVIDFIFIILLWIILGLFICHKAKWYEVKYTAPYTNDEKADMGLQCVVTVILAPFIFAWDILNRMFIQKWHK